MAGLLDGVPDGRAHGARFKDGLRAVGPGRVRAGGKWTPGGGGQEPCQRIAGEDCALVQFSSTRYATTTECENYAFKTRNLNLYICLQYPLFWHSRKEVFPR